ncbi:hypothetical protein JOM56_003250 [Amanita muscaria]
MDHIPLFPLDVDTPRYLPAYDETIVPYSLRLPTYRSSYIRRFHPYARYITPAIEDHHTDGFYRDSDEELLDLSIIVQRVDPPPENPEVRKNDLRAAIIGPSGRARELPEVNEAQVDNIDPDEEDNAEPEEDLEEGESLEAIGDIVRVVCFSSHFSCSRSNSSLTGRTYCSYGVFAL